MDGDRALGAAASGRHRLRRRPRAHGLDDQGRERLTFLPGQTLGETWPWPDWLRSDDALRQVGAWLRRLHDATAAFRPAADAVWFTGRPWQPGLVIAHLDASPWNAVWADGALTGFVDWDTARPSRREDDLAFSALMWVPLLTAEVAEPAGFGDAADRRRRFHLLLDGYGYAGDPTAIRHAIIGRVERNVAMIRQLADGGEPTFQRMLPWTCNGPGTKWLSCRTSSGRGRADDRGCPGSFPRQVASWLVCDSGGAALLLYALPVPCTGRVRRDR